MKLLIPTAKEMNLDTPQRFGNPVSSETQEVIHALAALSLEELASLYKMSEERASEEEQRIQALQSESASTYPALMLFDGLMYRNIRRSDWTKEEEAYVKEHLLITSALYGVIPALAAISWMEKTVFKVVIAMRRATCCRLYFFLSGFGK